MNHQTKVLTSKFKSLLDLDIQFFGRKKNALTEYYIGPWTDEKSEAKLQLADWISSVTDDSDESTEDSAFYSGDGTPESDVISVKKSYSFEGMYDEDNPAMKFIASLELEVGEGRKIAFKQIRTNGDILEGRATVTEIKVSGGEASEYAAFSCKIGWDAKPKVTSTP